MKKKIQILIATISAITFLALACAKTNEDALQQNGSGGGGGTCKTDTLSYSNDIVPILKSYCYGCHGVGNSSSSGGILLEGYTNLKAYVDNGKLVGVVNHAPGFVSMPYGQPKMPDCEVTQITNWVNEGALNN
jgi:hypothetical protein